MLNIIFCMIFKISCPGAECLRCFFFFFYTFFKVYSEDVINIIYYESCFVVVYGANRSYNICMEQFFGSFSPNYICIWWLLSLRCLFICCIDLYSCHRFSDVDPCNLLLQVRYCLIVNMTEALVSYFDIGGGILWDIMHSRFCQKKLM